MKILTINTGKPRPVLWRGNETSTAIFKEPTEGRLHIGPLNVAGDVQADLRVHGGPDKAVYGYAAEHYPIWSRELNRTDLSPGMFGENLTLEGGLFEDEIYIGDLFRVGTAELMAVQPRLPCFKLGIRFGTQTMVKKFADSGRFGVYFRVMKEGDASAGDDVERIKRSSHNVSIRDVGRLVLTKEPDRTMAERAARIEELPARLREYFQSLL